MTGLGLKAFGCGGLLPQRIGTNDVVAFRFAIYARLDRGRFLPTQNARPVLMYSENGLFCVCAATPTALNSPG